MRRLLLMAAAVAGLALLPASALAAAEQESLIQDDHQLLGQGSGTRQQTLNDIAALGADTIRVLVSWRSIAPEPESNRRPRDIDFANPASYGGRWDALDDVIRGAAARGLRVLISPSSPVPNWGSRCGGTSERRRSCKPNTALFGQFVRALGTRYSGGYADENQGGGLLPRVDRWSIWNEPNQPGWLTPQYEVKKGQRIAIAAYLYRSLAHSAIRALAATGHPGSEVLLGETAPIGRTSGSLARRPIPPVEFVRELFCLNRRGKPLRGSAARLRGCSRPPRLAVGGFAHHPYTRGGSAAPRSPTRSTEITIASINRLKRLLSQGARARRVPGRLPIHYTEYGFQTDPPDQLFGVTLAKQAEYINESDWIAFKDARIATVAQYKVVDEPNVANFQTGLRFLDGRDKPSYTAYKLPLWVVRSTSGVTVYGQVRPAADSTIQTVLLQSAASEDGPWSTVQTINVTSRKGHFTVAAQAAEKFWRLRWLPLRGAPVNSRVAQAARR